MGNKNKAGVEIAVGEVTIGFQTQSLFGLLNAPEGKRIKALVPNTNADVSYDLPRPSKEMVDELNSQSPDVTEFDVLEG